MPREGYRAAIQDHDDAARGNPDAPGGWSDRFGDGAGLRRQPGDSDCYAGSRPGGQDGSVSRPEHTPAAADATALDLHAYGDTLTRLLPTLSLIHI